MSTDPTLTAAEAEAVVDLRRAQIVPLRQPSRSVGELPWFVALAGPPGAGKSTAQEQIRQILGRETAAVYDLDDNPAAHPRYVAIMRAEGLNGDHVVRGSLPRDLGRRCLEPLRRGRYDVIMSAPLASEASATQLADGWKPDHRTGAVYIAASKADCTLGVANRFQQDWDANGFGRLVPLADTEYLFEPMVDTIAAVEHNAVFHHLFVADRNGRVLHENHLIDGSDRLLSEPRAGEAAEREQTRPPTESENRQFMRTAHYLLEGRDPRHGPLNAQVEEMVRTAIRWQRERGTPIPDHLLPNASFPTIADRLTATLTTEQSGFTSTELAGLRAATLPSAGHQTTTQHPTTGAEAQESLPQRGHNNRPHHPKDPNTRDGR